MKNIHEIEYTIEEKDWKKYVDDAFKKVSKDAKVDGFRKGKIPREIYEKKFGKSDLYYNAINDHLNEIYFSIIKDNNLIPIIEPQIDVVETDDNHAKIKFTITTKPEVKISKYKDLGIKKDEVKVTKEEINNEIENLRNRFADLVIKDGKIENGDIAVIDFEGFVDGKAFDGGKGENYSLTIGSKTFIPGFEESLIGHKSNEDVDVKVKFPDDYQAEELQGKDALFKVKIHEVKTKELPKLDEDFFLDLQMEGVNDLDSLKKACSDQIKARKEYDAENKYTNDVLEKLIENTEVDLPNEVIEDEIDSMMHEYEHNLQAQGMSLDMLYQFTHSDEKALREQFRNDAEKRVKCRYALEEIAKKEKVEVSDKEIEDRLDELAKAYNLTKEEVETNIGGKDYIKYDIEMEKAIKIIKE